MDGQGFDAWTRSLARNLPRRTALAMLVVLGLGRATSQSAVANEGMTCDEDDGPFCPEGYYCPYGTCVPCLVHGQRLCAFDSDCCGAPGLVCNEHGRCTYGQGGGKVKCNGKGCRKKKKKGKHRR